MSNRKLVRAVASARLNIAIAGMRAPPAFGADAESIDPIQVTATRVPELVQSVPASISVISGAGLRARPAQPARRKPACIPVIRA